MKTQGKRTHGIWGLGFGLGLVGCGDDVSFRSVNLEQKNPRIVADVEFPAAKIKTTSLTYQPLYGLMTEELALREKPQEEKSLRQLERPLNLEKFVQGHDGAFATQEFDISSAGKLDLLLVIDNSGSMGEEQAQLATNLRSLMQSLNSVDWQIGIITTDNCLLQNASSSLQPLRKSEARVETNFEATVRSLGTRGSRDEQGIKMAIQQIGSRCNGANPAWLRQDASLAVFFVSDEENECFGDPNCADDQGVKWGASDLVTLMRGMRKPDQLKAYALLWNKSASSKSSYNAQCNSDAGVETYGTMYSRVVDALGGLERSICLDQRSDTNDYGPLLEQVSADVNRSVRREFELLAEPVASSLVAYIDGVPSSDVQISGRSVILRNATSSQIKLKVSYRHDAAPRFDRLALKVRPAVDTIEVAVGGQTLPSSQYNYDALNGNIVFISRPQDKSEVKIRYRSAGVLSNVFDLSQFFASLESLTQVTIDGQPSTDWVFNPQSRQLSFPESPRDGALVALKYRVKGGKITNYSVPALHDVDQTVKITALDRKTGEALKMSVGQGQLIFAEADITEGRSVTLGFDYRDSERKVMSHRLMFDPIEDTVRVVNDGVGDSCIQGVQVIGRDVSFQCRDETIGSVTIEYDYVEERFNSFIVPGTMDGDLMLQVFVDGAQIRDFTVKGQTITIPEALLNLDSRVRILALGRGL